MVKIKGVSVYPSQLENLLLGFNFIRDFRVEMFTDKNLCDKIKIKVRFKKQFSGRDKTERLNYLECRLKDALGISVEVERMSQDAQGRLKVKRVHIIDERT